MKKKQVQTSLIGLFILLFLIYSPQGATASVTAYNAATITVTAGSDKLIAGTPIIIADSEFSGDFALATAIVYSGTTALSTQYDSEIDEFVFQLGSDIAASGSATFELNASVTGTSNAQTAISIGQGDYNATYSTWLPTWASATFMNGSKLWGNVDSIGDVIWVETDWGILGLQIASGWRQGTWKHVIMKDTNWDVVSGTINASTGTWRWEAGLFQDADPGWQHTGDLVDTVLIKKAGPVRVIIQVVANMHYKSATAGFDVKNANATRTYTVYNNFPGIATHFTLTGANATAAMTNFSALHYGIPLEIKHQLLEFPNVKGSNNLTKMYVPGNTTMYTRKGGSIDLNNVSDSYFAMYNETDKRGYVYNWGPFKYLANVTNIDPSDQVVINYEFDYLPSDLNRYWTPFSTYTGTIADQAAALNTKWMATYTTAITAHAAPTTTTTTTTPAPGFELIFVTLALVGASVTVTIRKRQK